jgi:Fe-S cluster biogenesis protein NfuA
MDGGDIELVDVSDLGVVSVRLLGACVGCPSSTMTLKLGVEQTLKSRIPQVREVVCV